MLAKRIIPCLDVKNDQVVKGIQFKNHRVIGDILNLVERFVYEKADEIVFYDITASSEAKLLKKDWIKKISKIINIPFCVAGGIRTIKDARLLLSLGADKISINSPAIQNPNLINQLSKEFGVQCTVVGIDSWFNKKTKTYEVFQYSGNIKKIKNTKLTTESWLQEVQNRGAGEIVLNIMNCDGTKNGYDIDQLKKMKKLCSVPLIASGGAGNNKHFYELFKKTNVDGALAASIFHEKKIKINTLKNFLKQKGIKIRT